MPFIDLPSQSCCLIFPLPCGGALLLSNLGFAFCFSFLSFCFSCFFSSLPFFLFNVVFFKTLFLPAAPLTGLTLLNPFCFFLSFPLLSFFLPLPDLKVTGAPLSISFNDINDPSSLTLFTCSSSCHFLGFICITSLTSSPPTASIKFQSKK